MPTAWVSLAWIAVALVELEASDPWEDELLVVILRIDLASTLECEIGRESVPRQPVGNSRLGKSTQTLSLGARP